MVYFPVKMAARIAYILLADLREMQNYLLL